MANIVTLLPASMVTSPTKTTALNGCMTFQIQRARILVSRSSWTELTHSLWVETH